MTMRLNCLLPFGAAMLPAGCTLPSQSPGSGQVGYVAPHGVYMAGNPYENFKSEMSEVGIRIGTDLSSNNPHKTTDDIRNCYEEDSTDRITGPYALNSIRYCYALDYLAYKDNQRATHNYKRPGNPFFSMDAAEHRWVTYNRIAQFPTADAMFKWMRGSYSFSKPWETYVLREKANRIGASRLGVRRVTILAKPPG